MTCELQYFAENLKIGESNETIDFTAQKQRLDKMFSLPRSPTCIGEQNMTPVMPSEQNGQMARDK